jgi:hypothetical protein
MDVVRGELGSDAAPREREPRADHRDRRRAPAERAQDVGQGAEHAEADEHERDVQAVGVRAAAGRCAHRDADHTHDDHEHRQVLAPAGVLAEHPLSREHEHDESRRERGLHDDEGSEQQRDHLQREAEDRHPGAGEPARAPEQSPREGETQVLLVGRALGLCRLVGDP